VTATALSRNYPSLRPDERLALMLAAAARGDDVEHERLLAAAPRVGFEVSHTFPRAMAFREVLDRFRAERLELAARYFQARRAAAEATGRTAARLATVARVYGYLLQAYRDGWAAFCGRAILPDGGLEPALVGGDVLAEAEGEADKDGVTADEVVAAGRAAGVPPPRTVRTAESVAGELAEAFALRLAWWESEGR
jgi:hypothetical protein